MFTLFRRKTAPPAEAPTPDAPKGLLLPESTKGLLATSRRQKLLEHIWQRTSLSHAQFKLLYLGPLERYAALVQQFPASEAHHHAYLGGMLDHGLEIVAYALKLRQLTIQRSLRTLCRQRHPCTRQRCRPRARQSLRLFSLPIP